MGGNPCLHNRGGRPGDLHVAAAVAFAVYILSLFVFVYVRRVFYITDHWTQ